jgi:hypothetical protein
MLSIAAYEPAKCEYCPCPPPKPPVAFCIGVNVLMTLDQHKYAIGQNSLVELEACDSPRRAYANVKVL